MIGNGAAARVSRIADDTDRATVSRARSAGDCAPWTPADDKSLEAFMWMQAEATHPIAVRPCVYADGAGGEASGLPAAQRLHPSIIVPIVAFVIASMVPRETQNGSRP